MKCERAAVLITRLVDDELFFLHEPGLRRHLKSCPVCQQALEEEQRLKEAASGWRNIGPAPAVLARPPKRLARAALSLAATLVLVAVAWIAMTPRPAAASLARMKQAMSGVRTAHVRVFRTKGGVEKLNMELWFQDGRFLLLGHDLKESTVHFTPASGELFTASLAAVGRPALPVDTFLIVGQPDPQLLAHAEQGKDHVFIRIPPGESPGPVILPFNKQVPPPPPGMPDIILFEGDPKSGLPQEAKIALTAKSGEVEIVGRAVFEYNVALPADVAKLLSGGLERNSKQNVPFTTPYRK